MLPEKTPLWVIFFTSPLSGLAALIPTMLVFEVSGISLFFRQHMPGLYIVVLAAIIVAAVWFVHHKIFMKDIRKSLEQKRPSLLLAAKSLADHKSFRSDPRKNVKVEFGRRR